MWSQSSFILLFISLVGKVTAPSPDDAQAEFVAWCTLRFGEPVSTSPNMYQLIYPWDAWEFAENQLGKSQLEIILTTEIPVKGHESSEYVLVFLRVEGIGVKYFFVAISRRRGCSTFTRKYTSPIDSIPKIKAYVNLYCNSKYDYHFSQHWTDTEQPIRETTGDQLIRTWISARHSFIVKVYKSEVDFYYNALPYPLTAADFWKNPASIRFRSQAELEVDLNKQYLLSTKLQCLKPLRIFDAATDAKFNAVLTQIKKYIGDESLDTAEFTISEIQDFGTDDSHFVTLRNTGNPTAILVACQFQQMFGADHTLVFNLVAKVDDCDQQIQKYLESGNEFVEEMVTAEDANVFAILKGPLIQRGVPSDAKLLSVLKPGVNGHTCGIFGTFDALGSLEEFTVVTLGGRNNVGESISFVEAGIREEKFVILRQLAAYEGVLYAESTYNEEYTADEEEFIADLGFDPNGFDKTEENLLKSNAALLLLSWKQSDLANYPGLQTPFCTIRVPAKNPTNLNAIVVFRTNISAAERHYAFAGLKKCSIYPWFITRAGRLESLVSLQVSLISYLRPHYSWRFEERWYPGVGLGEYKEFIQLRYFIIRLATTGQLITFTLLKSQDGTFQIKAKVCETVWLLLQSSVQSQSEAEGMIQTYYNTLQTPVVAQAQLATRDSIEELPSRKLDFKLVSDIWIPLSKFREQGPNRYFFEYRSSTEVYWEAGIWRKVFEQEAYIVTEYSPALADDKEEKELEFHNWCYGYLKADNAFVETLMADEDFNIFEKFEEGIFDKLGVDKRQQSIRLLSTVPCPTSSISLPWKQARYAIFSRRDIKRSLLGYFWVLATLWIDEYLLDFVSSEVAGTAEGIWAQIEFHWNNYHFPVEEKRLELFNTYKTKVEEVVNTGRLNGIPKSDLELIACREMEGVSIGIFRKAEKIRGDENPEREDFLFVILDKNEFDIRITAFGKVSGWYSLDRLKCTVGEYLAQLNPILILSPTSIMKLTNVNELKPEANPTSATVPNIDKAKSQILSLIRWRTGNSKLALSNITIRNSEPYTNSGNITRIDYRLTEEVLTFFAILANPGNRDYELHYLSTIYSANLHPPVEYKKLSDLPFIEEWLLDDKNVNKEFIAALGAYLKSDTSPEPNLVQDKKLATLQFHFSDSVTHVNLGKVDGKFEFVKCRHLSADATRLQVIFTNEFLRRVKHIGISLIRSTRNLWTIVDLSVHSRLDEAEGEMNWSRANPMKFLPPWMPLEHCDTLDFDAMVQPFMQWKFPSTYTLHKASEDWEVGRGYAIYSSMIFGKQYFTAVLTELNFSQKPRVQRVTGEAGRLLEANLELDPSKTTTRLADANLKLDYSNTTTRPLLEKAPVSRTVSAPSFNKPDPVPETTAASLRRTGSLLLVNILGKNKPLPIMQSPPINNEPKTTKAEEIIVPKRRLATRSILYVTPPFKFTALGNVGRMFEAYDTSWCKARGVEDWWKAAEGSMAYEIFLKKNDAILEACLAKHKFTTEIDPTKIKLHLLKVKRLVANAARILLLCELRATEVLVKESQVIGYTFVFLRKSPTVGSGYDVTYGSNPFPKAMMAQRKGEDYVGIL